MAVQHVAFFSAALFARKTCAVYLPPGYDAADQRYPVIYLLHGLYGSQLDWVQKGRADETLDRMIQKGSLSESIVVMPSDGEYGHGTFYMDWYDGSGNFEQYIIHDLIPYIDRNFRTIAGRERRMIAGLSMGGFGAFYLALRHPEMFQAAASMSGALGSPAHMDEKQFARSDFPRMVGPAGGPYARERDLYLLASLRASEPLKPVLYFNCGASDYLYPMNQAFRAHLDAIQYSYEYEEFSGDHNWEYWTEHLADSLRFIGSRLAACGDKT